MGATVVDAGRAGRIAQLERELEVMRLRLAVSRVVTRDVSQWVDDEDAVLDVIVDDVMRWWLARSAEEAAVLDGPDGFWSCYANRVEWAPAESGNEYRAEFCPANEGARFDTDVYFRAVWAAHAAELRTSQGRGLKTTGRRG
jgi:hypothetical protein